MKDVCSRDSHPLLSLEDALERMAGTLQAVPEEERTVLKQALGRVLARSVFSPINLPYDRNAAMDGYALSSLDIRPDQPFSLRLAGSSWAGTPFQGQLHAGECIRIFTGAVVPPAADSVVMQEQAASDGRVIHFPANLKAHQHIREAGEDVKQNELLVAEAKKLTAMDIALLAAAGVYDVFVKRRLKIAYFSTGDELIGVGQPLESGKIYDSNRYSLNGLLNDPCYSVSDLGNVPDDTNLLESRLQEASNTYDVIITTGGASVGEADYIKSILERLGTINFWKIAIKPGKPLAFGKINRCHFFGLPGNPVAVFVTFHQIVAPALMLLAGSCPVKRLRLRATCTSRLKKEAGRQEYQRGILTQDGHGDFYVATAGRQGSHVLSSMSRSQCYIVLPAECQGVEPGDMVTVEPFGDCIA